MKTARVDHLLKEYGFSARPETKEKLSELKVATLVAMLVDFADSGKSGMLKWGTAEAWLEEQAAEIATQEKEGPSDVVQPDINDVDASAETHEAVSETRQERFDRLFDEHPAATADTVLDGEVEGRVSVVLNDTDTVIVTVAADGYTKFVIANNGALQGELARRPGRIFKLLHETAGREMPKRQQPDAKASDSDQEAVDAVKKAYTTLFAESFDLSTESGARAFIDRAFGLDLVVDASGHLDQQRVVQTDEESGVAFAKAQGREMQGALNARINALRQTLSPKKSAGQPTEASTQQSDKNRSKEGNHASAPQTPAEALRRSEEAYASMKDDQEAQAVESARRQAEELEKQHRLHIEDLAMVLHTYANHEADGGELIEEVSKREKGQSGLAFFQAAIPPAPKNPGGKTILITGLLNYFVDAYSFVFIVAQHVEDYEEIRRWHDQLAGLTLPFSRSDLRLAGWAASIRIEIEKNGSSKKLDLEDVDKSGLAAALAALSQDSEGASEGEPEEPATEPESEGDDGSDAVQSDATKQDKREPVTFDDDDPLGGSSAGDAEASSDMAAKLEELQDRGMGIEAAEPVDEAADTDAAEDDGSKVAETAAEGDDGDPGVPTWLKEILDTEQQEDLQRHAGKEWADELLMSDQPIDVANFKVPGDLTEEEQNLLEGILLAIPVPSRA